MGFLIWLQETALAQFLGSDPYAYPILLCLHAIGMATVVGLVWVMSARVLGFPRSMSLAGFGQAARLAIWGFLLNALSGLLIFSTEATRVIDNTEFLIKMGSILLGGLFGWYMLRSARDLEERGELSFSTAPRIVAVLASVAWLLAIIFGRLVAYTIKPPF